VYGGDGLARLPPDEHGRGKAAFVPFVLAEEIIEATLLEQKPGFARARADEILAASVHRVKPECLYFGRCGGCAYQHAAYEHQLEIKAAILRENLRRIAKLELPAELIVHPSPPWNYRNRARLQVKTALEFVLGYRRFNSHDLVAVEQCPISSALINRAITVVWKLGRDGAVPDEVQEIEFFANAGDKQLLAELACASGISATTAGQFARQLQDAMPEIIGVAINKAHPSSPNTDSVSIASAGMTALTYSTQHASYRVSAGSFFQVNRHLTDVLVDIVTEGVSGQTAFDLYAGVGLFSTVLATGFAQVSAVEASPTSYADLVHNSAAHVKTVRSTSEQFLKSAAGRVRPDLVVVDPPRGGLQGGVVKLLAALEAPRIAYVSCDPATLSRDLAGLCSAGYRIVQAHMVDLFPQTYHLESVFHLTR